MKFKILVDKNKCVGCGSCVSLCDNFVIGEDGKAAPKSEEVEDIGCNQLASESCPVGAIVIKKVS